jgi:hypothetical protein
MPKGIYPRRVKRHAVIQPPDASYRLIPLTQNQNAIVDAEDFERLLHWNWSAQWNPKTKSFYAVTTVNYGKVHMHRLLLDVVGKEGIQVDHENKDTLDNRKYNLRPATNSQNLMNRGITRKNKSGFKGVYWAPKRSLWIAHARVNGKSYHLGEFKTVEGAACAFDLFAILNHKEFARTNLLGTNATAAQV